MGFYVNTEEGKETFLKRVGERVNTPTTYDSIPATLAAVCLVDNGIFTAAGVVFSQDELDAFTFPDPRPKTWYLVERDALYPVVENLKPDTFA